MGHKMYILILELNEVRSWVLEGVGFVAIVHLMYEVKIAFYLVSDNVVW